MEHSDNNEEQGEVQVGVEESDSHKEVQASEEDAEGGEVLSKWGTAMGDFSNDTPLPFLQDEPEGEVPVEIGANMEVEHEVENTTLQESTDVPAMGANPKQSAHLGASLSEVAGTDESPAPLKVTQEDEANHTSDCIATDRH
ncbi:hypothetical protein DXG01_003677 [Tephrocybe rancida]|nr:hypothetical protein DXG01_003677 [Tephrocybe rancida]